MVNRIYGKKIGMTRYFVEEGKSVPVTIVKIEPCIVVQKKTTEKDGYDAIQVGFENKKESRVNKPLKGHFKKAGDQCFDCLREIKVDDPQNYELGQKVDSNIFQPGDLVNVSGRSKGHGFSGVMKRWGFSGGRKTHGSKSHRIPGSIGTNTTPGRVVKGRKLPGRSGFQNLKIKNLKVIDIRPERQVIAIKGSLPGGFDTIMEISKIK
jgi:large subunit ribosomal protein L3